MRVTSRNRIIMNNSSSELRSILSKHAAVRMQQRRIPTIVVDLLLDYGAATQVGGGATSYRFTASTFDEAMSALGGRAADYCKYRNAYVVESRDGVVITAAWLH